MSPAITAPRGGRSRPPGVSHTQGRRARVEPPRCSSGSASPPVRMVEHPAGWLASGHRRPSLRGVVRAQARAEARAWRVTRRRPEPRRAETAPRPSPDVGVDPRRDPQPATSRSPVRKPHPLPRAGLRRAAPPGPGRPGSVEGKGAPVPSPAPAEGALAARRKAGGTAGGEGGRRGSCCRVPDDVQVEGLGRPSPGRLACVAGRSGRRHPPVGRGRRSGDRRDAARRCEHPGDPGRPRTSRCSGVRPVPRAEE